MDFDDHKTYTIVCRCGSTWNGGRLSRPQNVPCSECGERFLILPEPPPLPASFSQGSRQRKRHKKTTTAQWRWPFSLVESLMLFAGLTLVILGYLWKINHPVDN